MSNNDLLGGGNGTLINLAERTMTNEIIIRVNPEYTGRMCLYVENGQLKVSRPIAHDEFIGALDTFIELAQRAGWKVTKPEEGNEQTREA